MKKFVHWMKRLHLSTWVLLLSIPLLLYPMPAQSQKSQAGHPKATSREKSPPPQPTPSPEEAARTKSQDAPSAPGGGAPTGVAQEKALPPQQAPAQPSVTPSTGAPRSTSASGFLTEEECPPPNTAKKIYIAAGTIALALVMLLLFVRLMERRYIRREKSATLGRHVGASLALFLTPFCLYGLSSLIVGCRRQEFWLWAGAAGILWVFHGLYTLVAVKR